MIKSIEDFAILAGVTVTSDGDYREGKFGYKTKESPNTTVTGFRTEKSAYREWFDGEFGKEVGRAVLQLIKQSGKMGRKI